MTPGTIRWDQVHERLRASEAALRDALSDNHTRQQETLRKRAELLADEKAEAQPAHASVTTRASVLIFRLGTERYALELDHLTEVLPYHGCARVPGAVPGFLGVVNIRGELRPVADLARIVSAGAEDRRGNGQAFLLMLRRNAGGTVGVKVDELESLAELPAGDPTPARHGRFIRGLLPGGLLLLDPDAALDAVFPREESRSQ